MCIVGLPSVLKVAYCELQNTFTVTTYLFKVPEIPERHVPEERKPIPVPKKEAPPAKGISSALVKKNNQTNKNENTPNRKQTKYLLLYYFLVFLNMFVVLLSLWLWFCIISIISILSLFYLCYNSLHLSQLWPFSFLTILSLLFVLRLCGFCRQG